MLLSKLAPWELESASGLVSFRFAIMFRGMLENRPTSGSAWIIGLSYSWLFF